MRDLSSNPRLKTTLRKKIVLGFIVFVSIPILFFEIFLFRSWLSTTRDLVVHQYEVILGDSISTLQQKITSIEAMNDNIYRDYQTDAVFFNKLTSTSNGGALRNDPYLNTIFTQLSRQFYSQMDAELTFSFFSIEGDLIYQRSNTPEQAQYQNYLSNYKQEEWFQQVLEHGPENTIISGHHSFYNLSDTSTFISFAQVIRSPFTLESAGVSFLTIPASIFQKLLKSPSDNELIKTVVTNSNQNVLFTNDTYERIPIQSSQIVKQAFAPYGWEVKAYLSGEKLSQSYLVNMIQSNGLFVLVNLLLLVVIIGFLSRQLKPLYVLADRMKKAKEGHFLVKVGTYSTDELGMLCDVFNEMTTEIHRLFENQKKDYQDKLHFQLQSLESQINPHFIYNMLDLIQCRVYEEDPDKASELIVALSVIMRYMTTRPGEKVTCAEEVSWLKDYLFLQVQLIGEQVDVEVDFENQVLPYRVHKLILQPIIENAFIHGFSQSKKDNKLIIRAYETEGQLIFEVTDNGHGFKEPIDLILTGENVEELTNWGTGLYVTAQRFLLQSQDTRIELRSYPGVGTSVVMKQICMMEKANPYDRIA